MAQEYILVATCARKRVTGYLVTHFCMVSTAPIGVPTGEACFRESFIVFCILWGEATWDTRLKRNPTAVSWQLATKNRPSLPIMATFRAVYSCLISEFILYLSKLAICYHSHGI